MARSVQGSPVAEVNAPSAWHPSDFPDANSWTVILSDTERAALVTLGRGRSESVDVAALAGQARRWAYTLAKGAGLLRLRGFPIEELSPEETELAYLELGRLMGTPVGQDRKGNLLAHIRDERLEPGPSVRRYQTKLSQAFHTDASDFVGLLCLQPSKSGGMSRIVSSHTVYNVMLRHSPQLLALLYEPMPWSRHTEQRAGETPYFELAPIGDVNGVPRISVIPWFIRQSQEHPAAPRLTADQVAALDLLDSITNDPDLQVTMQFERGDVQWLNNTTILHARDAYEDYAESDLRRHLIRLWLTAEEPIAEEILRGGTASSPAER